MRNAIIAGALLAMFSGAAYAGGTEQAVTKAPLPAPIEAPQGQKHGALPTIHYHGDTVDGTAVETQTCGRSDHGVVTCDGSYVVVGSVIRTETMPAYVETIKPVIIETGSWTGSDAHLVGAPMPAPHAPKAHVCHRGQHCDQRVHKKVVMKKDDSGVILGGDFTGGVGYNVPSYYPSSRAVIVSTSSGGRSFAGRNHAMSSRHAAHARASGGCGGCCR